jgi:hypothetical protein
MSWIESLHWEQTELRALFGTQSGPYEMFVDLAGLARGVRDPPPTPEFSISYLAPYPARDVPGSDSECPSTLTTDGLAALGSFGFGWG